MHADAFDAGQLGGQVVLDDLGRRCVARDVARAMFAERAQSQAAELDERRRRVVEPNTTIEHVKAIQERQRRLHVEGLIDNHTPALGTVNV